MIPVSRAGAALAAMLSSVSVHAHEGHAAVGTVAHEIEHAGWMAAALMFGSVMILLVFSVSVRFADRHLTRSLHQPEPSQQPETAQPSQALQQTQRHGRS